MLKKRYCVYSINILIIACSSYNVRCSSIYSAVCRYICDAESKTLGREASVLAIDKKTVFSRPDVCIFYSKRLLTVKYT